MSGGRVRAGLATQPEPADYGPIAGWILAHKVRKKTPSRSDELEQTAARMIVLGEGPQMLSQSLDALRKQSDLDLRRSGISFRSGVIRHDAFLGLPRQGHPFLQKILGFSQF